MSIKNISYLFITSLFIASSCIPESDSKKEMPIAETFVQTKITDSTVFENNIAGYSATPEVVGVYEVPEMLVLSILDSSSATKVAEVMNKNYGMLHAQLTAIGAEMNGPVGMISYNNSATNFVFENVICIKQIPKVQPETAKVVVLESSKMLIFNFYGSYQNLFSAYDKIKKYCEKNDLIQSGPMREFYITDPDKEKNPEKWLTRIMLPVVSMKKK